MENDYVFDLQDEQRLWGDNKLPLGDVFNIEYMFKSMNNDLFEKLEEQPNVVDLLGLFDWEEEEEYTNPIPVSRLIKKPVYGKCLSGNNCDRPATHLQANSQNRCLKSVKRFSCIKHVSPKMVSLDQWLCKAPDFETAQRRCKHKARCYIDFRYGSIYCPRHAAKFWKDVEYYTE